MKMTIIGKVHGEPRYRRQIELGHSPRTSADITGLVRHAMEHIHADYLRDHPLDPFTNSPLEGKAWPDLTYSYEPDAE